jgi:anti-sigma factor RsiW
MTCHELHAVLYEFVGDELAAETRVTVEEHVAGCPHCGAYVETYVATVTMTRGLPRPTTVPPSLEARLKKMLNELGNV